MGERHIKIAVTMAAEDVPEPAVCEFEVRVDEVISRLKVGDHRRPAEVALSQWASDVSAHVSDAIHENLVRYVVSRVKQKADDAR